MEIKRRFGKMSLIKFMSVLLLSFPSTNTSPPPIAEQCLFFLTTFLLFPFSDGFFFGFFFNKHIQQTVERNEKENRFALCKQILVNIYFAISQKDTHKQMTVTKNQPSLIVKGEGGEQVAIRRLAYLALGVLILFFDFQCRLFEV